MHVKQNSVAKVARRIVGLFAVQCSLWQAKVMGGEWRWRQTKRAYTTVVHSHPASHVLAVSHLTVLTAKPWSVGWNPSVYAAKNRFHTLRWRGISWQDPHPASPFFQDSPATLFPPYWYATVTLATCHFTLNLCRHRTRRECGMSFERNEKLKQRTRKWQEKKEAIMWISRDDIKKKRREEEWMDGRQDREREGGGERASGNQ